MIPYAERLRTLPNGATTPAEPQPALSDTLFDAIVRLAAQVLGVEEGPLDPDRSFSDLGVSSLLAVRLLDRVNRAFGLRLGVDALFSHGNCRRLASHVESLVDQSELSRPDPGGVIGSQHPKSPTPQIEPPRLADQRAIAVIGYSGKFASAANPQALWQALSEQRPLISAMPKYRRREPETAPPQAGFMVDAERFDAGFFGLSPREAAAMDPVQRQFLEQAWCALEHAGLTRATLAGKTVGVYAGAAGSGYGRTVPLTGKAVDAYVMTGNLPSMTAARLAYFLDLNGPAVTVDTACSSSLMAVHLACQALLDGEVDIAIAGGASLFVDEQPFHAMTRAGMASPSGACRPFDDRADGIAVAEAAACVILKPLARVLKDGDRVDAVIRATGANQDGHSNGITAPNASAQAKLLRAVLQKAGLSPDSIDLVETHGTGTRLGDPIEAAALREAYANRPAGRPLRVSALKSCIGHASEAAGIGGLIAAILSLQHRAFPPIVGFATPNTHLTEAEYIGGVLEFSAQCADWPEPDGHPRRAAVSSFGLSGTNVHLIVEEAPSDPLPAGKLCKKPLSLGGTGVGERGTALPQQHSEGDSPLLFLLSAASPADLDRRRHGLAEWLEGQSESVLPDLARTLLIGREPMACRWGVIAGSVAQLRQGLAQADSISGDPRLGQWLAGQAPQKEWLPDNRRPPLALPTYPFHGPRLWGGCTLPETACVHPLLGEAQTDGSFLRLFHAEEKWVADHTVGGKALLHAALLLEMGLAAVDRLKPGASLSKLAFLKPLEIETATPVRSHIENGVLSIVMAGVAHFTAHLETSLPETPLASFNAESLWQALPDASRPAEVGTGGVFLGSSFPGPDRIRADGTQALAFLGHAPAQGFTLPPALLDAAIRTAAAVVAAAEPRGPRLRFPARLERLQRLAPLPEQGFWLHARRHAEGHARAVERVDVGVFGLQGNALVRLDGLLLASAPELGSETGEARATSLATAQTGALSWRVVWREMPALAQGYCQHEADLIVAVEGDALAERLYQTFSQAKRVTFARFDSGLAETLAALPERAKIWFIVDSAADRITACLRLLQALSAQGLGKSGLVLRIVTRGALAVLPGEIPMTPGGAAVLGLGKAAGREFPFWRLRLIDCDPALPADAELLERLLGEPGDPLGEPVALRQGLRLTQSLEPLEDGGDAHPIILTPKAHVIIVGGAGRLGRALARHLARSHGARLSLIGRTQANAKRLQLLTEIEGLGGHARYYAADITDHQALNNALDAALTEFGPASLLIQAAVDPAFARIERTLVAEFESALAPKIAGFRNLGEALANRPIGALAVFSSIGAFSGFPANDGQGSYCAACNFEVSHAYQLMRRLGKPVRIIHWGLWDSGDYPPDALARMTDTGLYAMAEGGIGEALEKLLRAQTVQSVHARLAAGAWLDLGVSVQGLEHFASPLADAACHALKANPSAPSEEAESVKAAEVLANRIGAGLAAALSSRGLKPDLSFAESEARAKLAALPRHRTLAQALLNMAVRKGLAQRDNGRISFGAINPAQAQASGESSETPGMQAALRLLERCLGALPKVLAGEMPATDVLFPEGSMDWVEPIYRDQPVLAECNRRLAAAVASAVAQRNCRILEIGAGTGSTTGPVLEALREAGLEHACHYLYTDVSKAFVRHGQSRYGGRIHAAKVLDISRPAPEQGIDNGAWDIIIASNVLHATPDIRTTLGHVAGLMAQGGIVLINEMVEPSDFATLTFGLLDGWWETQDPECRLADGPILSIAAWRETLRCAGLQGRWAYDRHGRLEGSAGGQAVLLAFKPKAASALNGVEICRHSGTPCQNDEVNLNSTTLSPGLATDRTRLEAVLRERLASILDIPAATLERDRPFMEIGVDSLIAPQIAEEVQAMLGCPLRVTDIYKHGNLAALAEHLLTAYPDRLHRPELPRQPQEPAPFSHSPAPEPLSIGQAVGEAATVRQSFNSSASALASPAKDAIAIIGLSARFAGAPDLDALWKLLDEGRHAIRPVSRFDIEPWFDADGGPNKTYARWGGFLDDYDRFDPYFFNITPAEAEVMDPQQRVLMEEAWKALENAGLNPESLSGSRCGLFIGASANNYQARGTPGLLTLGSSMAILSARMAYVLNLHGPNFPIDTGCSSSLVAIHQACQSLRSGECDVAMAGGVSVNLISPEIFLYLADAGMASHSGSSRTFDDGSDGFVPGEGAGVAVLKRLADALTDGDRIDAVIVGSGINQDGRTAGLTAPSADAQTSLVTEIYRRYGLNPAEFGMIEAHGTGTRLGDPIEVQALTEAFRRYTDRKGGCAIGSIKTNIGHGMAAAGMAGIAKTVLALRHRQIPASLNFSTPNRHIDFAESPFFVPTQTVPWPEGRALRAAVSSFGFSGTNAHIVLEPGVSANAEEPTRLGPWLFAVSARDANALKRRLLDLLEWLRQTGEGVDLSRVSETLARGRAHWRFRSAVLAANRAELLDALERAALASPPPPIPVGHIPAVTSGKTNAEGLRHLAKAYESGNMPDWEMLFGHRRPPLALPTYPFVRERFWAMATPTADEPDSYPLTAEHPLLAAHRVGGTLILPGTLSLELLRGESAAIADVTWLHPLTAQDVPTRLRVEGGNAVELIADNQCVLARGRREAARGGIPNAHADFAVITRLDGEELYRRFDCAGFAYGVALRSVEWVEIGASAARSKLIPPPSLERDPLLLSAALLDGALQTAAAIGYGEGANTTGEQWVPHCLGALRVWQAPAGVCFAHACMEPGEDPDSLSFKVLISDGKGDVLAAFEGMVARRLAHAVPFIHSHAYLPVWHPAPAQSKLPPPAAIALAGADAKLETALRRNFPKAHMLAVDLGSDAPSLARELSALPGPLLVIHALNGHPLPEGRPLTVPNGIAALDPLPAIRSALSLAQALLLTSHTGDARLMTVSPGAVGHPSRMAAFAIAGLYRTLHLESPSLDARVLLVENGIELAEALTREALAVAGDDPLLRYGGKLSRQIAAWEPAERLPAASRLPTGTGTVVISGGLGGIGLALGQRLAAEGAANIALLSRSLPVVQAQTAIREMERLGAAVLTLAADVSDPRSLSAALSSVRDALAPITAVYHLAGVLRDGFLLNKDERELSEVFAAKVRGAVLLDLLTWDDPIEAFVLFGSTAAAFGSVGQADYAAANAFLAAFADYRLARSGKKTLCVDWPLWAEGGMRPSTEAVAYLESIGMIPLPAAMGFDLLSSLLAGDAPHALALYGRNGLYQGLHRGSLAPVQQSDASLAPGASFNYLCGVLAATTKLPRERIEPDIPFEELGIDSIAIMKLNRQLEADLGPVAKTLFFEYRTPGALAAHLSQAKGRELATRFDPQIQAVEAPVPAPLKPARGTDDAIAIVGIAGLYPMAENIDVFWDNLREGRDCVQEIPKERWPLEGFYHPDRNQPASSHCKWGGFIGDADCFDARFFGISPLEAETLDPQARKFMEVCWNALEDAGLDPERMFDSLPANEQARRACGVFVGVMYGDYQLFGPEEAQKGNLIGPNADYWNIANRVSAFLDLHGPSMAVDTACSSSLSAIHLACQSIRAGDSSMAIAGGVNLCLHPRRHWILSKAGMAASDGRCHSFGADGDGYVPGEGIGAVVLKPLSQAKADGDRIQGIILGSSLNHGGRVSGYTVPNPVAQGDAVSQALLRSGIDPRSVSYVEAHGTGTPLGDPIEVRGLARAFAEAMPADLAIGSVKASIGHLESAAGIAGLTKVLLQMRERSLAPTLHADPPNPGIDFTGTGFRVVTRLEPWHGASGFPLRAGISSFGAGGSNAHLLVEAGETRPTQTDHADTVCVLLLSAHDEKALRSRAAQLALHLLSESGRRLALADIAYTLAHGRKRFDQRLAVVGSTREVLAARLQSFADGNETLPDTWFGRAQKPTPPAASANPAVIAAAWVAGAPAPELPGRRVALPGYPFAKRRLWVNLSDRQIPRAAQLDASHRFLTDQAPLIDHKIGGRLLLPGATSLSLALDYAASPCLRGVVWPAPGIALDGKTLEVRVRRDGGRVEVLAADGTRLLQAHTALPGNLPVPPDIKSVEALCHRRLDASAIYAALASAGAEYGPSLQVLEEVRFGNGVCLARLRPGASADALLDAAFQVCFTLIPEELSGLALLPAEIGSITLVSPLEGVRSLVATRRTADKHGITLDFQLLDADGMTVAWLADFQARATAPVTANTPGGEEPPLRVLRPEWAPIDQPGETWIPQHAWVLAERSDDPLALALASAWGCAHGDLATVPMGSPDAVAIVLGEMSANLQEAAARTGYLLETLLRGLRVWNTAARPPSLLLLTREAQGKAPPAASGPGAAAAAFLRAAARERSDWNVIALDLPASVWEESALGKPLPQAILNALPRTVATPSVPPERQWRNGVLSQRVLAPVILPKSASPWRDGDVLLIAGSGGLGGLLARHAAACANVSVALLGRSASPNRSTVQTIEDLRAKGCQVSYLQADIADRSAVAEAVQRASSALGPVSWLVHTALVMGDAPLSELSPETLHRVLAPKSLGLANLTAAVVPSRGLLLFSSSNALTANPGQAAYAAASAFVDAASLSLPYPVHVLDWGFWGETGAVADSAHQAHLARLGVLAIRDREGLETLERVIGAGMRQAAVLRVGERLLEPMGIDLRRAVHWRGATQNPALAEAAVQAAQSFQQAAECFADPDIEILNAYAARRLWLALADLGVPVGTGQALNGEALAHALNVKPDYQPLAEALAELLQRAGLSDNEGRSTGASASADALARERARLEADVPATAPTLALLEVCLNALGDVMAGRREAAEVLFGGGDAAVAALYQGNPVVDHFQGLTATAVAGAVRAMQGGLARSPVRILEVGAGTGSTTGFVLDALNGLHDWRYRITDLGASLVAAAADRLDPSRNRLEASRLDVTMPLGPQGVEPGSVEVLIAANVLHATPDLFDTLSNLKEALSPGGLLILNEATSQQDINTLTFGLTPGWWAFRDRSRRCPHGPLLDPARWDATLAESGFTVAARFGLPLAAGGEHPLQNIIVAVADGYAPSPTRRARPPGATPSNARQESAAANAPGLLELEQSLRRLIAETLRLDTDELGIDDSFAEHGADSILSVELVRRINANYGIDLKSTALFNYSTVRELVGHMAREHGIAEAPPGPESQADEGKRRAKRLLEVIGRRREAAPVNREAEFWQRESTQQPNEAKAAELLAVPAQPADLDEVLRRLESGELSVAQALELNYADE